MQPLESRGLARAGSVGVRRHKKVYAGDHTHGVWACVCMGMHGLLDPRLSPCCRGLQGLAGARDRPPQTTRSHAGSKQMDSLLTYKEREQDPGLSEEHAQGTVPVCTRLERTLPAKYSRWGCGMGHGTFGRFQAALTSGQLARLVRASGDRKEVQGQGSPLGGRREARVTQNPSDDGATTPGSDQ